jgi:hypothetical protein
MQSAYQQPVMYNPAAERLQPPTSSLGAALGTL